MEYKYKVDKKHTMWERSHYTIDADNQEEADKLIIEVTKEDTDEGFDEAEWLYDTCDEMTVQDNDGQPTIEIIRDDKDQNTIWTNKE